MTSPILSQVSDQVLTLTLNRADKKNALTVEMYKELVAAMQSGVADPKVRVIVLQGTGGVFTAGNDLGDFIQNPPVGMDSPVMQFLLALVDCPKPVLAAVQGPAVGIGTTLLLHCDLVWADDSARFRMPFVSLGLCPEGASSYLLPRIMGHARAAELLMFGDAFDAQTALTLGLITGVRPAATLLSDVHERARTLAQKPPASIRATKDLMRRFPLADVKKALKQEGDLFAERVRGEEAIEAFGAFFDKRAPDFSRFE
jgi:enoyl-CoA hydratase/carnithine racemase